MKQAEFSELIGQTIASISGGVGDDQMIFTLSNGDEYRMFHEQDCCEDVRIEDIDGDLSDLVGSPILVAEESTNSDDRQGIATDDSFTWTFYRIATVKGYVVIRWLGESNGYYSERVSLCKVDKNPCA